MQKYILLSLILTSIISGCASQVTVTSEVTVTLLPPTATIIPTPTLHPEFIALQVQIAAAGERFTLSPDGTIEDGGTVIPGLQVSPDGKVTIMVDGKQVEIDPALIKVDDESGISAEGLQDIDGDGNWKLSQSKAVQDAINLMTDLGISPDSYTCMEVDGNVLYMNLEGNQIDLTFLIENLDPEKIEQSNYIPTNGEAKNAPPNSGTYTKKVLFPNIDYINSLFTGDFTGSTKILLHDFTDEGGEFGWGFVLHGTNMEGTAISYLAFNNTNNILVTIPIKYILNLDVANYYRDKAKDQQGSPEMEP